MLCAKRYILSHSKLTTVTRDYFYNYPQGHTVNGVKFELSQEILEPLLITATLKNRQKVKEWLVTRGWERGDGELLLNGYRVSMRGDEKILKIDSSVGCTTL